MIPYPYNMVDMGGIDLAEANGTVVDGLYAKIVEAVNACGDTVLYNWKFAGIEIAPQHTQILVGEAAILINSIIQVTELDEVSIISLAPPAPVGEIIPLDATENRVYRAVPPIEGFNPVNVAVPIPEQGLVLSGTEDPAESIGVNEQLYVKYQEYSDLDYRYGITGIFRKVNGLWVDYVAPRIANAMHVWTASTSGTAAAMNFQSGYIDADNNFVPEGDIINVVYTSVSSPREIDLVSIQYGSSWVLRAVSRVNYNGTTYESGSVISAWTYLETVDYYIKEE